MRKMKFTLVTDAKRSYVLEVDLETITVNDMQRLAAENKVNVIEFKEVDQVGN